MKLGYRGNLQAMLVLQTIQKNTPKTDGVVITKSLKLHQSAPSERIEESGRWREREKEGENKRKNSLYEKR